MVRDFMAALKQVDTLRLGLNIDSDVLLLLLDVKGTQASYLAGLLTDPKADVRLGAYQPDYPMQFRSRAYNMAGVMQMLGASFGQMYNKMGFDFDELAEIAKGLTGEMAGGMALDQNGMTFEMVYALHDTVNGEAYLTQVYLPWFEKYNLRMAALMENQTGQSVTPLYERMPDTTVAGKKVIGVRTRFPAMSSGRQPGLGQRDPARLPDPDDGGGRPDPGGFQRRDHRENDQPGGRLPQDTGRRTAGRVLNGYGRLLARSAESHIGCEPAAGDPG